MITVKKMTVNHFHEAIGIDEQIQFGWALESDASGVFQKKYTLEIASDGGFSNIVWQKEEETCKCQNVVPEGFVQEAATEYFARVKVLTNYGEWSEWSENVHIITGLQGNWTAKMITPEITDCSGDSKTRWVQKKVFIKGKIKNAFMFSSAFGVYSPWINGRRVGEDLLAPGWTNYHKHLLYQTNDVSGILQPGWNLIGAVLGAGWYKGLMGFLDLRNNYGTKTAFLCQILVRYEDGTEEWIISDASWICGDAPVIFSEIYHGEHYDARLENPLWGSVQYDESDVQNAAELAFGFSSLTAQPTCRIRCETILPAVQLIKTPEGDRVIDFGQNLTGWPEFVLNGKKDTRYELKCFETLDAKGNVYTANLRSAKQAIVYTCKEDGRVSYHPEFTFYGFRYVWLKDWPEDAEASDFKAWVVHSEIAPAGHFECSEPLVNQLAHNIEWSLRGNFLDVPTDCPQRDERMGWTGDAQIFCETSTCFRDTYSFYRKWLADVRADQTPDGGIPHVVPDIVTPNPEETKNNWLLSQGTHSAAAWADAIVICPWVLYCAYGDEQILKENYRAMKAWIDFMHRNSVDDVWNYKLQFGDWVSLDSEPGSYFGATPNDFTCTAYYAYSTGLFVRIAKALGNAQDAEMYEKLYQRIVSKFRMRYLDENGKINVNTQTAHILALQFGLIPKDKCALNTRALADLVEEAGGHLKTGFMGTPFATFALGDGGCVDEAYDLLLKDDFPSWLFQIRMGATTIWEHWDGMRPDGTMWSPDMNSFNHYAYGSVGAWLYRRILGINYDPMNPGYAHSIIRPQISSRMQSASGWLDTPYGKLAVSWKLDGDTCRLHVEIPANTTATVYLPISEIKGNPAGAAFEKDENGMRAELVSGKYDFEF